MDGREHEGEHPEGVTAEFWRAVRYTVEWANLREVVEVEQPPIPRAA